MSVVVYYPHAASSFQTSVVSTLGGSFSAAAFVSGFLLQASVAFKSLCDLQSVLGSCSYCGLFHPLYPPVSDTQPVSGSDVVSGMSHLLYQPLFRQNTYLQNKKHTLTCQVGLVVTDLITSPIVSWEGWETPPPPPAPRLCCHSLLNHRRGKTSLLLW